MSPRSIAILALALVPLAAPQARSATCMPLTPDSSGVATAREHIPDALPLCYSFAARAGQHAIVDVSKADSMSFGVESVLPDGSVHIMADYRQKYEFVAEAKTYHVLVGADAPHGDTSKEFTLTVTLK